MNMRMHYLLHHLIEIRAARTAELAALSHKQEQICYGELFTRVQQLAGGLRELGLQRHERVAIYLPKQHETVISLFAATLAGGVFVPINPVLKPPQVQHILSDCTARILITSHARLQQLAPSLACLRDLKQVILVDDYPPSEHAPYSLATWHQLQGAPACTAPPGSGTDADMAAILYTSGSTGKPKGVVLSHRNLMVGAQSVAGYLDNTPQDRILAVLPLSFDAGLSQVTTAFESGACCYLMDYLLPNDVRRQVTRHQITGITAVPPLWNQIASLEWSPGEASSVRYFANTGGHMPQPLLTKLRRLFPNAQPFLMYGLTEAFRSTYLPPDQIDLKPGSIGKAIPNAEVLVLREDGAPCQPHEPGELVHRGPLVSQGYWNDPEKTRERFRPVPAQADGLVFKELAVWSGDTVTRDEEGYLYFVGRRDQMIKTSGYRVSPDEIEEMAYQSGLIREAAAVGLPHATLGQAILLIVTVPATTDSTESCLDALLQRCREQLPNFMVPHKCILETELPRNPNGKIDRRLLAERYADLFDDLSEPTHADG
ncbi:acyl-CoA ligase (AMP-forming), exosortase A system-associated [Marinobacterium sedimentorum]|uniref:acyl-CoA ligase (AMP-forming), exosortase A system-associated n=1 Tax=Marinobacterium sedimentorum TaxID=2927804 RepID=UPI0020C5C83E|nr:acyl-CoA ligase (AMP-forming), exosortase A system-associated [Marinobacterium sedimentorum]MCP8686791.1 acyl-CoA ligase (AMP-forming), exosortase A system-associated [Marinobacterium sedimentorum]